MKYVDEFRDPKKAQGLIQKIHQLGERLGRFKDQPIKIMEACGGHTHSIFK